ncbi:hypothetical protein [Luteococcus sp. OSA5]|uniref:hypothetical protein n=1 Tax=Luteococcus sp. OSA5 TaxID=3401630 RepID=UPI003B431139
MTDPKNSPKDPSGKADQAKTEAQKVGRDAKQQAEQVKQTAVQDGQQVLDTAKQEATQVAAEAGDQLRGLLDTTVGEFRGRAHEGQTALAGTVRGLSDELSQLTRNAETSGPVAQLTGDLANRGTALAGWLENHEPDDVVLEVRRFAARKPGTFLALAAGAGLLAGRLARGTRELAQDEQPVHSDPLFDQERPEQFRGDAR